MIDYYIEQMSGLDRLDVVLGPPAFSPLIRSLKQSFQDTYEHELPEGFTLLLSKADGLRYRDLVIWPIKKNDVSDQSILDVNASLREVEGDSYIFFGRTATQFYVFNQPDQQYQSIEVDGHNRISRFNDGDAMIEAMLREAMDQD